MTTTVPPMVQRVKLNDIELVTIRVAEKFPPKVELLRTDFAEFNDWKWERLVGSNIYLFERIGAMVSGGMRPELQAIFAPDGAKDVLVVVHLFALKYDPARDGGYTDVDFNDAVRTAKSRGRLTEMVTAGVLSQVLRHRPVHAIAPAPAWLEDDLLQHLADLEKGRAQTEDALRVIWDGPKA